MARILVAEDDEEVRGMFHEMLVRAGHEVVEARDGRQAVKQYVRDPVDLMITDLAMPKKHGYEAIAESRRRFPDLKAIAISRWGSELLSLTYENGASRTFAKPVGQAELLRAVDELLGSPARPRHD